VLLEAMAAGKPIVASAIEGYMGIVAHGQQGLLFRRRDSEALADALSTLIKDRALAARMGATGRQLVEQYRWEVVARQVEDYYYHCMEIAHGCARQRAG
jgi:phosphatidylinositol alpha-mannosyltransferase